MHFAVLLGFHKTFSISLPMEIQPIVHLLVDIMEWPKSIAASGVTGLGTIPATVNPQEDD